VEKNIDGTLKAKKLSSSLDSIKSNSRPSSARSSNKTAADPTTFATAPSTAAAQHGQMQHRQLSWREATLAPMVIDWTTTTIRTTMMLLNSITGGFNPNNSDSERELMISKACDD
jgi:hypothetical protein